MGDSNLITSSELSELRTKEFQMETGDSLFIIDRLEEQGTLRAHEYIGGCLCVGPGYSLTGNAPLVAEVSIMRSGRTLGRMPQPLLGQAIPKFPSAGAVLPFPMVKFARVFLDWECPTCGRGFHNEVRQNPEDR